MNCSKNFYPITLVIFVLIAVIIGWKYVGLRQEFNDLEKRISEENQFVNQDNITDPPSGETDTSDWFQVKNEFYNFSLLYPHYWIVDSSGENIVIPQDFISEQDDSKNEAPLTLMVSSNTEISNTWRKINLANGESAYYNFEDGFDHYYMVNNDKMLIWTIPARSHDGLYTDQQLVEAIQIVNTYQPLI